MKPMAELLLAQAERLVGDVKPLFAEQHPVVLSVALAELVATHFASMRPDMRAKAYEDFRRHVDEMIPECERQIFPDGLPPEWRG
jgi:hypothetical protein